MWLTNISFFLCTWFSALVMAQNAGQRFDKIAFYEAMKVNDSLKINEQLNILQNLSLKEKQAYQGALLLKKAGIVSNKKDKLTTFKLGKRKLESALEKDSNNVEYHFLRLMIQEKAPKILGYHTALQKDNIYIRRNYRTLNPVVQQAVLGYSKQSKILGNLATNTK